MTRVSVLLPVYNGAADVGRAIESILKQSFTDFELLVADDASPRDNSWEVLYRIREELNDPRLHLFRNEQNLGLAGTLNLLIGKAKGEYLARQDQDDLSDPRRLALQVEYLDAHPDCALLGTRAQIWIGDIPTGRSHDHALTNGALQFDLLSNNPFVHSSVMIRASALDRVGLYSEDKARQPPEDYEFWSRIARIFPVANLPEYLLIYREVPGSMSRDGPNPFLDRLILISAENIAFRAGLTAPDTPCFDAACLIHAAPDRLSPKADLALILARAAAAARGVIRACPEADLSAREAQLLANLRHHFMLARSLPAWSQPLVRAARATPLLSPLLRRVRRLMVRP